MMNLIILNIQLNQVLLKLVYVLQKSMLCKFIFNNKVIQSTIFHRFSKARVHGSWVDAARDELCRILKERHQLVTIFNFDNERHHGKLENAILEAVFNGLSSEMIDDNNFRVILAARFCRESDEQYQWAAELRLALVIHEIILLNNRFISFI